MNRPDFFKQMFNEFLNDNPNVKVVIDFLQKAGEPLIFDHIGFRTFNYGKIDITSWSKYLGTFGFVKKDEYKMLSKHIILYHFEHENIQNLPKILIGELQTEKFSNSFQLLVKQKIKSIPDNIFSINQLLKTKNSWGKPSYEIYQQLREESEFGAWIYTFGLVPNHFALLINEMIHFSDITKLNEAMIKSGQMFNCVGGLVKGSPELLLEQSNIVSNLVPVQFKEGMFNVPYGFIEFTKRYADGKGVLFGGFIAESGVYVNTDVNFHK